LIAEREALKAEIIKGRKKFEVQLKEQEEEDPYLK